MSDKFHINNKGKVGKCTSEGDCPFGGIDKHYLSEGDAENAIQEELRAMYGVIPVSYEDEEEPEESQSIPQEEIDLASLPRKIRVEDPNKLSPERIEELREMKAKLMSIQRANSIISNEHEDI